MHFFSIFVSLYKIVNLHIDMKKFTKNLSFFMTLGNAIIKISSISNTLYRLFSQSSNSDSKWFIIKYFCTSSHFTNICNKSSHFVLHNGHLFESVLPNLNSFSYVKISLWKILKSSSTPSGGFPTPLNIIHPLSSIDVLSTAIFFSSIRLIFEV